MEAAVRLRWWPPVLAGAALLAPGQAMADPITIVATLAPYIGGAAAAAVATVATFVATYGGYIYAAYSVYGGIQARREAKKAAAVARRQYNDSLQDRMITTMRADPPWRIIYGRAVVGGDIVAVLTSDKIGITNSGDTYTKPDALKHLVIVLAAHQVHAIHEVMIDGIPVGPLDGNGWATSGEFGGQTQDVYQERWVAAGATVTFPAAPTVLTAGYNGSGDTGWISTTYSVTGNSVTNTDQVPATISVRYTQTLPKVRVEKFLGTDNQAASAYLQSVCPAEWTANDRLRGLAGVVVTLDLDEPRFQSGPPLLTFDVSGRLLYDPRTNTTAHSDNPALVIRDWLTAPFGLGVAAADVDDASVIAAANACDETISLTVGNNTTNGARYTCNGSVTTDSAPEAVLEDLALCMAGTVTHTGGLWVVNAGVYTVPVLALTEDLKAGPIEVVQAGAGYESLFNGVRGTMIEHGRAVQSEIDPYINAAYVAADGQELWVDRPFNWTDNRARARNLARIWTEQNREGLVIRYPAMMHAWPLVVGDRVTVTDAEHGWSAKVFRVTDWQWSLDSAVLLTLQEDGASIYDLADAATADSLPNTGLPDPFAAPPAVTGLAANSGGGQQLQLGNGTIVDRVLVSWTPISSAYVTQGGRVELRWRRLDADAIDAWRTVQAPGDATQEYLVGARAGDMIVIGAAAINSLGVRGPETLLTHLVEAGTPPSAIEKTAPVYLYRRTATVTPAPSGPANTLTYTFATAGLSGALGQWQIDVPATGGAYLWRVQVIVVSTEDQVQIAPGDWSSPRLMAADGADGAQGPQGPQGSQGPQGPAGVNGSPGTSVAELNIYRRANSTPATPSGGSFNFSNQDLTAPSGWSVGVPSGIYPCYVSRGIAVTSTPGSTVTPTWGPAALALSDGQAVDVIFRRSASQPATPSPSSGVPSGWYSQVSDVPAGSDPLWSSYGERPAPGANWTWQAPVQVQGINGTSGALNADPGCKTPLAWELLNGAVLDTTTASGSVGTGCLRFDGGALNRMAFSAETIPLNPARRYRLTARLAAAPGNNRNMYVVVRMFRSDGSELNGTHTGWGGTYAGYVYGAVPTSDNSLYEYGADFGAGVASRPIPADAVYCRIGVWGQYSGTGSSSVLQLAQDIRLLDVTDVRAAQAAAEAAATAASNAQTSANNANNALADIAADSKLTPVEKLRVRQEWETIYSERAGIRTQADNFGITTEKTAYDNAFQTLGTYLNNGTTYTIGATPPLWITDAQLSVTTNIAQSTFRSNWSSLYTARQDLLNKIAAEAALRAAWTSVSGRPSDDAIRNNLVDLEWWRKGGSIPWPLNGELNQLISVAPGGGADLTIPGPRGGGDTVWYCKEQTGDGEQGGGWDSNNTLALDPTKTYRFVVPVRRISGSGGNAYWGPQSNTVCDLNTTTANGNPYFVWRAKSLLESDRWYLFVGYVYPYGSTGNSNESAGVWDCKTGAKVVSGTNFCHAAGGARGHRAYQYYANLNDDQVFGRPMVNVVDGTEPSLREYFEPGAVLNSALVPSITAAQQAADAAATAASNAQTSANNANNALADIAADSKLTPVEKLRVRQEWETIYSERAGIRTQADNFGITTEKTAYDNAFQTLGTYLNNGTAYTIGATPPLWITDAQLSVTTNIAQSTFRSNWSSLYSARQALLNKIAAEAALRATWASVSGRPLLLRVVSRGYDDTQSPGNIAAGLYNGETGAELYGRTRSYMMLRIDATTGAVTFQQTYDVLGAGANTNGRDASSLAADLNATPAGTLVVVYTHDEPKTNRLTGNLPEAIYRCGGSRAIFGSAEFKARSAYLLVGIAGCGEGNGYEAYSGSVDNDTQAWTDVAFQLINGRLIVSGTGARPRTLADYGYTGALNATRNLIWRQGSAPTVGVTDGDVWFDTSADNRQYARIGGAWVSVRDAGIAQAQGDAAQAIIDAANAQVTANGKVKTFAQASPPTASGVGDLWMDTDDGNRLYRWTGSAWAAQLLGTGAIAPGAATQVFGAFDAGPRTATNNAAPVNVVAAAACQIIVTVTVNAQCVNSTGSTKYRNAIVSVYGYGDSLGGGTTYDSRFISRNIANGETQRESYTASYTFTNIAAGANNTFSASVTGTTGATIDTEFTDIRVRVEVIYR
jgi:hypothetical protein